MKQYLDILKEVYEDGVWKNNRTGIRSKSISGAMFKHDMSKGFPILTSKQVFMRVAMVELEGFIKGISDKSWFQERNCHIWDEWCNPQKVPYSNDEETKKKMKEENDLGRIYGSIWNDFSNEKNVIKVKRKFMVNNKITYPLFELIDYNGDGCDTIYKNKIGLEYKRISNFYHINDNGVLRKLCDIQFCYTGFCIKGVRVDVIRTGYVKDIFHPSICGIAAPGNCIDFKLKFGNFIFNNLRHVWGAMVHRCYKLSDKEYKYYGGRGVYVCPRWLIFQNFLEDIQTIPNWEKKLKNPHQYQIDKDHFGSNVYSKDTCVWLEAATNALYRISKPFSIIDECGNKTLYISQTKCGLDFGINPDRVSDCLTGKLEHYKKYKFEYLEQDNEYVYRYQLPFNQLQYVINEIKTNPDSRRALCTAWNPLALEHQALPPCHYSWQVTVTDNKLNLFWNMRSNDIFLGLPFNIISYAMLLKLLAKETGYEEGILTGFLADTHIYENQIEQVELQLSRANDVYPLPTCEINNFKSIYDWGYKDYTLVDYKHHSKILAPVAV